jgi:RND family efflux transporter MFP subunit
MRGTDRQSVLHAVVASRRPAHKVANKTGSHECSPFLRRRVVSLSDAGRQDRPSCRRGRLEGPEVPVARPVVRQVTDYEDFTGRTEAPTRVELRARVTGYLVKATFQEGTEVKQGDVLFEIDGRLYRAELEKAEAAVGLAEARLKLADANRKRAAALLARSAIGQEEVDKAVAERAEAEAAIRLAKAGLDVARLNLAFTRVLAPVTGQIGRRLIDPGNLVAPGLSPR